MKRFDEFLKEKAMMPKKPINTSREECPVCGNMGTMYDYGQRMGTQGPEEDIRFVCDNPRCRSHEKQQHLSQFA